MRRKIPSTVFILLGVILLLSVLANIQGVIHPVQVPGRCGSSHAQLRTMSDWPRIALVVEPGVESSIPGDVDAFEALLEARFYQVIRVTQSWANVAALRSHLQTLYGQNVGLVGAVLLGDLPACWHIIPGAPVDEIGGPVPWFQSDLYLMDLDGHFEDLTGDGYIDFHSDPDGTGPADMLPEIWVSRIVPPVPPPEWQTDRMGMISDYINTLRDYLDGTYQLSEEALLFVDNPWMESANGYYWDLADWYQTSDITLVSGATETTENRWLTEVDHGYDYGHIMVHAGHRCYTQCFWEHDEYSTSYLWYHELRQHDVNIPVLNLFTCKCTNFTHPDYIAGWYLFGPGRVASAIGSSRDGGMLFYDDFFLPQARGWDVGRAFFEWFSEAVDGYAYWYDETWWRGMTLLGDPTFTLSQGLDVSAPLITQNSTGIIIEGVMVQHPVQGILTVANRSDFQLVNAYSHLAEGISGELEYTNNGWRGFVPFDTIYNHGGGEFIVLCRFETDDGYAGTCAPTSSFQWPPILWIDLYWPEYVFIIGGGVLCMAILIIVMYVKRATLFGAARMAQTH